VRTPWWLSGGGLTKMTNPGQLRDCPQLETFWILFCSAYSPLPLGDKPNIDRFLNTFLIAAFTVQRQLYQPHSWSPAVPSGTPTPSLGLQAHQLCPSISRIIFLQPSHLPALSFLKFFQGAISAAFHTIDHSQTPSKHPVWCRRSSIASTQLNHPSSTGRIRPTTLHT
jgi:hypothetical protein